MTCKATLLLLGTLFLTANAFAQATYFKDQNGKIADASSHKKEKAERVARIKSKFPEAVINEDLTEVYKNNDSIIYAYKLTIKLADDKGPKGFQAETYIGREFPLNGLRTIDGEPVDMEKLKGKPTLINFWFTACKPCIEEMPVLNELQSRFSDSVNFIAVTYESTKKVKPFLQQKTFGFTHVTGAKKLIDSLKMIHFPTTVFLDKDGRVVSVEGGIPYILGKDKVLRMGDGKEFEEKLRKLL